jgi:hypothetical protein
MLVEAREKFAGHTLKGCDQPQLFSSLTGKRIWQLNRACLLNAKKYGRCAYFQRPSLCHSGKLA